MLRLNANILIMEMQNGRRVMSLRNQPEPYFKAHKLTWNIISFQGQCARDMVSKCLNMIIIVDGGELHKTVISLYHVR